MDGRKITRDQENPIDNILLDFATYVNPYLHSIGVTPNMLTAGSFLFGLITVAFIYHNMFEVAAVCYLIAYTFDCMDGNMARMFNEVTEFGDKFDHYTDLVQIMLLIIFIVINTKLSYRFKIIFFVLILSFFALTGIHIGCQEKWYNEESDDLLTIFKNICPDKEAIRYTRYIGTGTANAVVVILLIVARFL